MTAVRLLITIGLTALWSALFIPPMFMTPPSAVTGVHYVDDGTLFPANRVRVDRGSPGYRAGLRTGDVLQCLSMRDASLLLGAVPQGYTPGSPISTCVQRAGKWRKVTFTANAGPPVENSYGSDLGAAIRVCVVFVFFLTGIALVTLRPGLSTWLFFAFAVGDAPSYAVQFTGTVYPAWLYAIALGCTNFVNFAAVAFLLLFAVVVPDDSLPHGWRRPAFAVLGAVASADILLDLFETVFTGRHITFWANYLPDEALSALTILVVLARLATMKRFERARFGWAAFAIIFGVVANDLRNVLSSFTSIAWFSTWCGDLTIVLPVCLLYAILTRHIIDIRFAMSRTVVFAALTTFVVGIIGLADWATSAYLHEARAAMAIDAAVTVGVAFAMHRAYKWMESVVDFFIFRRKHDAETYLNRMGKTLARAKDETTIDRAVVEAPFEKFDLTGAALYRAAGSTFAAAAVAGSNSGVPAFDEEHELVRFLATERTRLHIADLRAHVAELFHEHGAAPAVAIPLFQSDALAAFAVYGIHRDGTKLDPDEIETLERLCEAAAQAYTAIELSRYRAIAGGVPMAHAPA